MSGRSRAGVRGLATAAVLALSLVPIGSLDLARADSLLQRDDPITQVSNRGTRVEAKTGKRAERERMPRELFLLRRDQGSAVYRIGGLRPGYTACYASGPGNEIGKLGSISCARSSFPSRGQPLFDLSLIQYHRGVKHPQLYRLQGVAADAIAAIGLADAAGHVLKRITVEQNVYLLAAPPSMATGVLVGYDRQGDVVYRSDRRAQSPAPPPAPNPRRLAPTRTPSGAPLQRGRTDDVAIAVYRSGVVALRFETSSRLYRQLQRKPLSVACLTFDQVSRWSSRRQAAHCPSRLSRRLSRRTRSPFCTTTPLGVRSCGRARYQGNRTELGGGSRA